MKKITGISLVLTTLLIISCRNEQFQQKPFQNTRWTLIAICSTSDNSYTGYPSGLKSQTIVFKDSLNTLVVSGICNGCLGTYNVDNNNLNATIAGCTKVFCDGVDWEQILSSNLASIYSYKIGNDSLTLLSKGGYNLVFRAE